MGVVRCRIDSSDRVRCSVTAGLACVCVCVCCVFVFQAEDGIRDLVRSRGLGDVYKRQVLITTNY